MPGERPRRVAEQIQRYLSSELIPSLRDPRLGFVTVTSVDISRDLKTARVFVTVFDQDEEKRHLALKALAGAAGRFRRQIGMGLRLRYTPALTFQEDLSVRRADRVERLIRDIHASEPPIDPAFGDDSLTEESE